MSLTPSKDPRRELDAAEAELQRRLDEACAADLSGSSETTGELMRLEETLLAAARAAEQAISLRRAAPPSVGGAADENLAETPGAAAERNSAESVREFTTRDGRRWRVWMVSPEHAGRRGDSERYLGEFHNGWLAFEQFDGTSRRRLPNFPADWRERDDDGLEKLLGTAVVAPQRKLKLPESGIEAPKPGPPSR